MKVVPSIHPEHASDFRRLAKTLAHGPDFQLLIVDCPDQAWRDRVLEALQPVQQAAGLRATVLSLGSNVADVSVLESRLTQLAPQYQVIHIMDAPRWMDPSRWAAFNLLRERLSVFVRVRLVLWLNTASIVSLVKYAGDLWAWRAGIYRFAGISGVPVVETQAQRIAELRAMLSSENGPDDELSVPLAVELGERLYAQGELEEALRLYVDVLEKKIRLVGAEHGSVRWSVQEAERILGLLDRDALAAVGDVRDRLKVLSEQVSVWSGLRRDLVRLLSKLDLA